MAFRSTAGERTQGGDIVGMAGFKKSLHAMDTKMLNKTLSNATRKAVKPVLKAMRQEAKGVSTTLAASFGSRIRIYKRSKVVVGFVGVRNVDGVRKPYSKNPKRGDHDPRFTFHLVDLGVKPHRVRAFGKGYILHPGNKAANIREKAFSATKARMDAAYAEALDKAIREAGL